jgi:[protein-PII] uridylyltransferase
MERAAGSLIAVREALHAELKRKSDRIRMDLQPRVASHLGFDGPDGADELMARVHSAARTIEHEGIMARDALAETVLGGPKRSGTVARVDDCVRIEDGVLHLSVGRPDLTSVVRLACARARTIHPIDRRSIAAASSATETGAPERWGEGIRTAFLDLLRAPRASIGLELLDHLGAWDALLPEWRPARGRAQHDPYHRYTVDGHSFLAVEEVTRAIAEDTIASGAALEAGELDALYVAALLHDVGKGSGEDHCVAGERIARAASARMGLGIADADDVAALVRRHLLLADTATRRDLDDGAVVENVAKTIGDDRRLRMLYILTVADGRATGPEGWTTWKEALVRELYRKTLHALETGEVPPRSDVAAKAREVEAYEPLLAGRAERVLQTLPPSYLVSVPVEDMAEEVRILLRPPAPSEVRCRVEPGTEGGRFVVTIAIPDRPGALARTAGVFALNRISVLRAQAYSTSDGVALQRFIAEAPGEDQWERFERDLIAAYSGQLALEARLERKARDYRPSGPAPAEVRVLQDASDHSTVIEVRAHDALGLLYAVTAGLSDLDLDIHVAKIDTLGERVVDVFYVRTARKGKLSDEQAAEVERAIVHRLERVLGGP